MHTTILTVALAAIGVSAIAAPAPQITQAPALHARAVEQINRREIDAGYTPTDQKERDCITKSVRSLAQGIPPLSGDLLSWVLTVTTLTVPETITEVGQVESYCDNRATRTVFSVPASLSSAYSAYKSEVVEWQKDVHEEAYSLAKECGGAGPYIQGLVATDAVECKKAASAMFGATSTSEGAGPRETGLMAAAAAIAGVAGVLAAM